jgi:hypothetical protein
MLLAVSGLVKILTTAYMVGAMGSIAVLSGIFSEFQTKNDLLGVFVVVLCPFLFAAIWPLSISVVWIGRLFGHFQEE